MQRLLLSLIFLFCFQGSLIAHAESTLKAAFIREGNLWLKVDKVEKQITNETSVHSPVWSYDGKWIAYTKKDGIWVYETLSKKSYQVYHDGGSNCQWAPDKNVLAFQDGSILDISDIRSEKPKSFTNVALGVGSFSWMPDGNGFLVSSNADLLPDGWTNSILFKVPLGKDLKVEDLTKNVQRFFTIPGNLKKGNIEILAIGTSGFKWSPDKKWISFLVNQTASLSMDSNMLCVLSSDGKKFEPLDEMASGFPFYWAPTSDLLGYIQGSGRMVFGFKNKSLNIKELPALQSLILTPKNFVDLSFTWESDKNVIVSRSPEQEWSNIPSKWALPILFKINIQNKDQKQISSPPIGYGDFNPEFLYLNQKLTWTRSNWEQNDVWISEPDGTSAKKWIENVDYQ
ncbi:MAG TPA: TolB domain-containing protein, partial [Bacillota bacterium]|nr:TolB domain-containing protein [Bacillota bacterium]